MILLKVNILSDPSPEFEQTSTTGHDNAIFTSPSIGMSVAKGEQESTETLSFRCDCERCRLMRGRIVASLLKMTWF